MENLKRKKATVGRDFMGRADKSNVLSVSFKKEDYNTYNQLVKFVNEERVAASEVVVDALRLKFGHADFNMMKAIIVEKYTSGELEGPELFKTFEDIIEWELKNSTTYFIPVRWKISAQQFACLLYLYGISSRDKLKDYNL